MTEQEQIKEAFEDLLKSLRKETSKENRQKIKEAFEFANEAHKGVKRRSGEPYILHPLAVAKIAVKEIGLGTTSVISALLHDVVEDTDYTVEDIANLFGPKVASIVDGLTKISGVMGSDTSRQAESFRKMILTLADDVRVILIKIADRLHNMRTLASMPEHKQVKIASETLYIYAPLAHRMGLHAIKTELEDLSMKYEHPEEYEVIDKKIEAYEKQFSALFEEFIKPIRKSLSENHYEYTITARTKSVYSVWLKMQRRNISFDEIYDLLAVRIVFKPKADQPEKWQCWNIYSLITDIYSPKPERIRDWVSVPKANGYEALHLTVMGPEGQWFEVQIRSERMDEIAEKGFAAHWKYKGGSSDSIIENWLNELREILESNNENALELLDDMKINLQDKEVHVFTPKGDLITLQAGATLLDFAYAIHTNIGSKCVGGIVNHRNETLKYVLKNGDQVSIITAANQQPKADWLSFTVTSKARNKIRQYLNEEINHQADIGKETLMRRLKNWKIEFNDEVIRKLMQHYKYKFALDLYHGIAIGKHDPSEIKEILTQVEEKPAPVVPPKDIKVVRPKKIDEDVLLIDKNVDNVEYKFARCCNPVYGDDIIGFVSIGEGIKVHRRQCKNALELVRRYPYRIVKTRWTNDGATSYQTVLNLTGKEDGNIINKITELIAKDPHATLRAISINAAEGVFDGNITVLIDNTEHLSQLISRLKHLEGVVRVNRHDSMLED